MVGTIMEKLVKRVSTYYFEKIMCIIRDETEWCSKEIYEQHYYSFTDRQRWKLADLLEQSSRQRCEAVGEKVSRFPYPFQQGWY